MQSAVGSVSDRLGAENELFVRFQLSHFLIDFELVKNMNSVMRDLLHGGVRLRFECIVTE